MLPIYLSIYPIPLSLSPFLHSSTRSQSHLSEVPGGSDDRLGPGIMFALTEIIQGEGEELGSAAAAASREEVQIHG